MFKTLKILFSGILILMIAVTIWASLEKNVLEGFAILWRERWGLATLADANCGFLTFYAWVFYKEPQWVSRFAWFVAIIVLGNITMSFYMLMALWKLGPEARAQDLLLRKPA